MYIALLDSCVLWPSTQRDFLLSLAFEGAYRFICSEAILAEVEANEELKLLKHGRSPDLSRASARHLVNQMRTHFADSIVRGWEGLDGTYGLPDPDDEHVLAAAVVGNAGNIITKNLRDFPSSKVPHGIQIVTPEDFAYETVGFRPQMGLAAVLEMSRRRGKDHSVVSPIDILDLLDSRYGMNDATALIRELL